MEVVRDLDAWRHAAAAARQRGRTVGLVPTMGALHAGHDSLVRAARDRGDYVIVTIFVNPRQFNDLADLRAYPRTPETDRARAAALGVDLLVEPSLEQMWPAYPAPVATTVHVGGMTEHLEGADRPGHFDGVASVVAKLFALTGPARAYFGEKDFQQLAMVRQMVTDLGFAVEVVACPIVREEDGLALSSRNVRLSAAGRQRALSLSRAVAAAAAQPATARDRPRARARPAALRRTLRLDKARPSSSRTIGQAVTSTANPRSATIWRTMASCWKSFSPK